ncbi:subtilisin [Variovorax boronicumulans]|uniref:S8 family peptidase n=1 Tax=Variovorax boronicumulans TaxID=436515 RepID=UPI002785423B|nr:S8 family serine peptidase [Variovorax boronicumulans]MDQ0033928.1 subtilisin [Variovorax boronicumulans]
MAAASKRQEAPKRTPVARDTRDTGRAQQQQQARGEVSKSDGENIERLLQALRLRRMVAEPKFSDDVIVWPSRSAAPGGAELATLSAINLGNSAEALGQRVEGRGVPRMKLVKQIDDVSVMKANSSALLAMRRNTPGLRIAPAAWAYLQYIRPLGDEMDSSAIQVAPGAKVKRFELHLADPQGKPVAGVRVKALVNWDGAHVPAVTDSRGIADLGIPVLYPRVEMILVEPEHTHWSVFVKGFDRVAAPRRLNVQALPLVPDSFQLLANYAPYDPEAGAGVTVGVIDSGVGPHADIAVAGGACFVTGENAADFLDNGIGHGTHVAGIIAGRKAEATGIHGLAPACRLLAYRVCPKSGERGRAKSTDIASALERAIADGCHIVNISMGSLEPMPEMPDVLQRARDAGVVVFAATGNDGQPLLRYPARYSHTMAVGALGRDGTFPADCPESFQESEIRRKKEFVAEFSNYGLSTDFIGPGVAVLSTFPGDRYAMMSGTSMATPYTSGMAARLLSGNSKLLNMPNGPDKADAIVTMLSQAAQKVGWPAEYEGFGVLKK